MFPTQKSSTKAWIPKPIPWEDARFQPVFHPGLWTDPFPAMLPVGSHVPKKTYELEVVGPLPKTNMEAKTIDVFLFVQRIFLSTIFGIFVVSMLFFKGVNINFHSTPIYYRIHV